MRENTKKSLYILGIFSCLLIIGVLFSSLHAQATNTKKDLIPEPSVRPNVPQNAIWDSELGLYISGSFEKNSEGEYVPIIKEYDFNIDSTTEEKWLEEKSKSKDPIDLAIIRGMDACKNDAELDDMRVLSCIPQRVFDLLGQEMFKIPEEDIFTLWERICTEPEYRFNKIVGLEAWLKISAEVCPTAEWSQKVWYDDFLALKNNIPDMISKSNLEKYGLLLLPEISKKAQQKMFSLSDEKLILDFIETLPFANDSSLKGNSSKDDIRNWLLAHEKLVNSIQKIIENDFSWTE